MTTLSVETTSTVNTICNEDGIYNHMYGINWPPVDFGEVSLGKCRHGNGYAKWLCCENGFFDISGPDFTDCFLDDALNRTQDISSIFDVLSILEKLVNETDNKNAINSSHELMEIINITKYLYEYVDSNEYQINFEIALKLTKSFGNILSNLINQNKAWLNSTIEEQTRIASDILLYTQYTSFIMTCFQNLTNDFIEIQNENIITEIFYTNFKKSIVFKANGSSIIIPAGTDIEPKYKCNNSAAGALINHLERYLSNDLDDYQIINTEIIAFSATNANQSIQMNDGLKVRVR